MLKVNETESKEGMAGLEGKGSSYWSSNFRADPHMTLSRLKARKMQGAIE